jgi:hypothetical protein
VAALHDHGSRAPDRRAAEAALIELVAEGKATGQSLGDDALWRAAAQALRRRSHRSVQRRCHPAA